MESASGPHIHMNGRVYDPNLGRFLSVDPVFAFPTNTQSLNPYTYVLNNPLSMTDPTGYVEKTECGKNGTSACESSTTTDVGTHINGVQTGYKGEDVATLSASSGNGARSAQSYGDAQNKPSDSSSINSPSTVSKAAVLSNCSFHDSTCDMPKGVSAASADWLKQHHITQNELQDKSSGYSATIYIDSETGQVFVAFRGTEINNFKDVKTDVENEVGKVTQQYKEADALGRIVAHNVSGQVIFTGQSLGGGLASVAALRASMPAITFNAAGVSQSVLNGLGLSSANANRLIQAYYVRGEPLTTYQSFTPLPSALGTPHPLTPTFMDVMKAMVDPGYLHTMPAIQDALPGGN